MSKPNATDDLAAVVSALMPQLERELSALVAIPSISVAGYPESTRPALLEARDAVVELFRDAGVDQIARFSTLKAERRTAIQLQAGA